MNSISRIDQHLFTPLPSIFTSSSTCHRPFEDDTNNSMKRATWSLYQVAYQLTKMPHASRQHSRIESSWAWHRINNTDLSVCSHKREISNLCRNVLCPHAETCPCSWLCLWLFCLSRLGQTDGQRDIGTYKYIWMICSDRYCELHLQQDKRETRRQTRTDSSGDNCSQAQWARNVVQQTYCIPYFPIKYAEKPTQFFLFMAFLRKIMQNISI